MSRYLEKIYSDSDVVYLEEREGCSMNPGQHTHAYCKPNKHAQAVIEMPSYLEKSVYYTTIMHTSLFQLRILIEHPSGRIE